MALAATFPMLAYDTRTRMPKLTTLRPRLDAARAWLGRASDHRHARWLSPALGVAMLGALALQVAEIGWGTLARVWPASPLFYLMFAAAYLGPIACEIAIYRRLWGVSWHDAPMFLKKRVMNEALIGYSGEAYALWWARRRPAGRYSALAAVKDTNLVSGLVGNIFTFALLAATLLLADGARLASAAAAASGPAIAAALGVIAAVVAFVLLKPRLFTLPRAELGFIAAVQVARVATGVAMTMALWALAMPGVAWGLWLTLVAWRTFIGRLPFVPNKELLFVNLAILALGDGGREVAALLVLMAALTMLAHLVVALALSAPRRASTHKVAA